MSKVMEDYYKDIDPFKGSTCMLTMVSCNKNCTKCVFAKEAYRQALKEKKKVKG